MCVQDLDLSKGNRTYIIAEIGSNHCQDLVLAKETIEAAKKSGADAVKFQHIDIDKLYLTPSSSLVDFHKKIDITNNFFLELKHFADKIGIEIFSAPTYLEAIDFLESINVQMYKIASAQASTFPQLVEKVAKTKKKVFLSTGLSTYSDIERAIKIITSFHQNYILMHCNSLYPTPPEKVNLGRIEIYRKAFSCSVGFSDHTLGIHVPIAAVALGARVIEKHFILDKSIDAPDSIVSLDLSQFSEMVTCIREVEEALMSQPRLYLEKEENLFLSKIKYKLVLRNSKKAGDAFTHSDFYYRRCERGIDCSLEELVIKDFVPQFDLEKNTVLEFSLLKGRANDQKSFIY